MSKVFLDGPDPMIVLDLSGAILDLNAQAERTYGWSRQELIGRPVNVIVARAFQEVMNAKLLGCRAGETVRDVEWVRVDRAGRELKSRLTLLLLTDESSQPEAICMLIKREP